MRLTMMVLALAGASLAMEQEKAPPPAQPAVEKVSAVIRVKTLSGDAFQRLVKLLSAFNASFSSDERLRTIVVYAPKDVVEQMKRVVQELDRPGSEAAIGRNVDLTLTFLRCSMKPNGELPALPADLESVAKQLRAATPYKAFEVWEVLPFRVQEGKQTEQTARLPGKVQGNPPSTVQIKVFPDTVTQKDGGRSVRFDRFNLFFHIAYQTTNFGPAWQFLETGLNTSGDFREGQKTVVGKVGFDDESAVFVVVTLKVLD